MPFGTINLNEGHARFNKLQQFIYNIKQIILAVEWIGLIQTIKNKLNLRKQREKILFQNLLITHYTGI